MKPSWWLYFHQAICLDDSAYIKSASFWSRIYGLAIILVEFVPKLVTLSSSAPASSTESNENVPFQQPPTSGRDLSTSMTNKPHYAISVIVSPIFEIGSLTSKIIFFNFGDRVKRLLMSGWSRDLWYSEGPICDSSPPMSFKSSGVVSKALEEVMRLERRLESSPLEIYLI